jgi:hypothetical protein
MLHPGKLLLSTLLIVGLTAGATSIPVSEDSFSSGTRLTLAAGKGTALKVSDKNAALLRFDLPPGIAAAHLQAATLRLYVAKVSKPGSLQVRKVDSDWSEESSSTAPLIGEESAAIPGSLPVQRSKKFVFFDIRDTVRAWLNDPDSNLGLAIVSQDASVLLGAKEGSGVGYPAELEIQVNTLLPVFSGGDPSSGLLLGSAIAPGSIGSSQLGVQSVLSQNLGLGSVTSAAIAPGAVGSLQLGPQSVQSVNLGVGSVTSTAIAPGAVGSLQLSVQSVLSDNLGGGSVTALAIAADAVDGSKVLNGSLTGADLLDASVPAGKVQFQGAIFWEQQPYNVNGGPSVANTWQRRTLNAETNLSGGSISRAGNTLTLQPGIYYVRGSCPAAVCSNHQAALRDVTGPTPTVAILGTSEYCTVITTPGFPTRSLIEGYITVNDAPRDFELWHFLRTTYFSDEKTQPWNFGVSNDNYPPEPSNNRENSIYSVINIVKLK